MDKDKQKKAVYDPKNLTEKDSLLFYGKSLLEELQIETLNTKQGRTNHTISGEGGPFDDGNLHREKTCWQKFIINPKENKWKAYFDNFVLLLVIYSTITTSYYVAFDENAQGL